MDDPKSDWFVGDVDCDGNELITVRKDEWNTICEQREKFMWQVRDTCTRAEKAETRLAQAENARLRAFAQGIQDAWITNTSDGDEFDEGYDDALSECAAKARAALEAKP